MPALGAMLVSGLVPAAITFGMGRLSFLPGGLIYPAMIVLMLCAGFVLRFVAVYLDRHRATRFLRGRLLDLGVPVCLGCGYYLRGLTSDRCPECGREIDDRVAKLMAAGVRI